MPDDPSMPVETSQRPEPQRAPRSRALRGPILVAIDEAGPAEGALHLADLLARRDRVNAHLLGAAPPVAFPLALVLPAEYEAVEEARRQQLLTRVRQQLNRALGLAAYWSTEAAIGPLATVAARSCQARGTALVVVGIPEPGAPDRTAREDAALQVVRAVEVPVLIVPPRYDRLPQHALVAMDFSDASRRAARTALAVLGPDPMVTLAHVQPDVDFAALGKPGWEAIYARGLDALVREVADELRSAGDVTVDTVVRRGDVVTTLLALARERGCDLIAAGTQGGTPLERHLVGSVSTATLRGARSAVLIA
ncbi:MAG: universal stress protein, partial [Gemmatimonadaceae bacterium]|nr:universal stress protein [Gemmatimonadaceae bacterium]